MRWFIVLILFLLEWGYCQMDLTEQDMEIYFQHKYHINPWSQIPSNDNPNIAYGFILYHFEDIPIQNAELVSILSSVWNSIVEKYNDTSPGHPIWGKMTIPNIRIHFARKQDLGYTLDGHEAYRVTSSQPLILGTNFFISFRAWDVDGLQYTHNVTISKHMDNYYLFGHTHSCTDILCTRHSLSSLTHSLTHSVLFDPLTRSHSVTKRVRVLSYNAWNTNPANWFLRGKDRYKWYLTRMKLFAQNAMESKADIIVFQEIRFDETLGDAAKRSQIGLLASLMPGYQYIFQAANMYMEGNTRIEEGVAIFTRHSLTHSDYLLLSRNKLDKQDNHQRLLLHAVVDVEMAGRVHVYGTHLSLSEQARNRTVHEIAEFMSVSASDQLCVLCGDLNAEPHEHAMQFLMGKKSLDGKMSDMSDAFLEVHPEPLPYSLSTHSRTRALSFPTDNPVKRIDYVIFKGGKGVKVRVSECTQIGQQPEPGTETTNMKLGMMSAGSAIWPSDHRGVVAEFEFE